MIYEGLHKENVLELLGDTPFAFYVMLTIHIHLLHIYD